MFAQWENSIHPSQAIAINCNKGRNIRALLTSGETPPCQLWKSVSFLSSDGASIQGWLCLPDREGPFPNILNVHGGPEGVLTEVYLPAYQAWVDHGFAYLSINYRGPSTFESEFEHKIYGNPGHWEIKDMVASRGWLIENEISIPTQIFLSRKMYR